MHKALSLSVLAKVTGGTWLGDVPKGAPGRFVVDSRQVRPSDIFVALPGERADGHSFLADAFARGAAGALVSRAASAQDGWLLRVPDVLKALQAAAAENRKRCAASVVGITGSTGKTSSTDKSNCH